MPDILVEVRGDWLKERKAQFLKAIEGGVAEVLHTPRDDKISRLVEHPLDAFSIPCWAGERFTHIEVVMFKGRSLDTKRALYSALVRNLESVGVPPSDIKIILIEVLAADVGMRGGRPACDLARVYRVRGKEGDSDLVFTGNEHQASV